MIFDNSLVFLYIALGLLAFCLVLFKLGDFLSKISIKKASPKSKDSKEKGNNKATTSEEKDKEVVEEFVFQDLPGDDSCNYLYDRFVVNPTCDDSIPIKTISDTFISEEELQEIKEKKTSIRVTPVKKLSCLCHTGSAQEKIANIIEENKSAKSKLLEEFDGLSKEMKLLLIQNILEKIE